MAQYFVIHPENPQARLVKQAVAIVRDGGVIAFPTDSAYALGCHLGDAAALARIRAIRGVDDKHHMTLMCRDLSEIARFAIIDNRQFRILKQGTPGAFTFILPATREVPKRMLHPKRATIGLRVPKNPIAQALLEALNEPLLTSTLILAGETEALHDPEAVRDQLQQQVDLVIADWSSAMGMTTVVDLASDDFHIVRQGLGDAAILGL